LRVGTGSRLAKVVKPAGIGAHQYAAASRAAECLMLRFSRLALSLDGRILLAGARGRFRVRGQDRVHLLLQGASK